MRNRASGMRHRTRVLPEFGNIIVQVGNSRLGCAGPESILPMLGQWIPGSLARRKIDASINFVARLPLRNDPPSHRRRDAVAADIDAGGFQRAVLFLGGAEDNDPGSRLQL